MIERHDEQVWDILEEVTKGKTVMLNRAPTLHRLSIQSFEPVLVEGEAIRIHPMVCTAFNADFDGDQMAVHVPLSVEAQLESRLLMLASNSIFSPAPVSRSMTPHAGYCSGIITLTIPSQSDKLAARSLARRARRDDLPLFNDAAEVDFALAEKAITYHTRIRLRNPDFGSEGRRYGTPDVRVIETTAGRVIFNEIWPDELGYVNDKVDKSKLGDLILHCHQVAGCRQVQVLDELKTLGFNTQLCGCFDGFERMIRPQHKEEIIANAHAEVEKVNSQFLTGVITDGERHNKIVDVWTAATEKVSDDLYKAIDRNVTEAQPNPTETNPVFIMVDSKSRGSKLQIRRSWYARLMPIVP